MKIIFKTSVKFSFDGIKISSFEKGETYDLAEDKISILNDFYKKEAEGLFSVDASQVKQAENTASNAETQQPNPEQEKVGDPEGEIKDIVNDGQITAEFVNSLNEDDLLNFAQEQNVNIDTASNAEEVKKIIIETLNLK